MPISTIRRTCLAAVLAGAAMLSGTADGADEGLKVMQLPIRTDGPKSLDPVEGSTTYDNMACAQFYETLLTNKYASPMEMEPLLLTEMPTTEDGGTTWHFTLKDNVFFHDNACFPGGKGRKITADDVFYSLKRLADDEYKLENWWLLDHTIAGFNSFKRVQNWRRSMPGRADWLSGLDADAFKSTMFEREFEPRKAKAIEEAEKAWKSAKAQASGKELEGMTEAARREKIEQAASEALEAFHAALTDEDLETLASEFAGKGAAYFKSARFDYGADVEGFQKTSDTEFTITLTKPVYRFLYILGMFQTSVVAHEAVEHYGKDFARNPVGTGPFILDTWVPKQSLTANRNPNYHPVFYPAREEWSREDMRARLHRAAGKQVPFVDRVEFTMFVEDQPMWLEFNKGNLGYTQVPEDYFTEAFDRSSKELKEDFLRRDIRPHSNKLLDFTFRGFNMEDELLGGYTSEKRALRRAISYAIDLDEINETFYSGRRIVYDGPIPPGLEGYPENGRSPAAARGRNIAKAREMLVEAGYPNGEGLPPIRFVTSQNAINNAVSEMVKRQLAEVNIKFEPVFLDFSTLIETINKKKAPMFGFAWSSDYPDGENNLALFYGPNEAPGSNHYNYKRAEYDALYEQILTMGPSEERTAIYARMRDMVLDDCAYVGGMARERFYLMNPWLLNCKPTERYYGWFKYLDVDDSKRE
ncbi:MAG: hypothetical protein KC996_01000 [Phycisphaerales bacterium]|nr:hypothetical protein [Phycisphaerales bacterium]